MKVMVNTLGDELDKAQIPLKFLKLASLNHHAISEFRPSKDYNTRSSISL